MGNCIRLTLKLTISFALFGASGAHAQIVSSMGGGAAPIAASGSFYSMKIQAASVATSNAQAAAAQQAALNAAATASPMMTQQQSPWAAMLPALLAMAGNDKKKANDTAPSGDFMGPTGENYSEQAPIRRGKFQEFKDYFFNSSGMKTKDAKGEFRIYRGGFLEKFEECTVAVGIGSGCLFQNWGIVGDSDHASRASCHNAGEAIDVGPITCGGKTYTPKDSKFQDMIRCFAKDEKQRFQVITSVLPAGHNIMRKGDHEGHMHIQLKCCNMAKGRYIGESGLPMVRNPNACK